MCTLTYIPQSTGYLFTHNRDERQNRPSSDKIVQQERNGQMLYFPQDLEARGTWIAASDQGRAACLLNGGSIAHQHRPPYRKSRGLVVLESFEYPPEAFHRAYNFDQIEPFTLILRSPETLVRIVHNESETLCQSLDTNQSQIWSSTMLYTREVREKRERWFDQWLEKKSAPDPGEALQFHQSAGDGDQENDLVMSRWGLLKTLSVTQVQYRPETLRMQYLDLVNTTEDEISVPAR